MKTFKTIVLLVFSLSAVMAWGEPFMDDFDRPDDEVVGNDWTSQTDGSITVEIVDNEVLIAGTQGVDWARAGISRTFEGETKIYFDFMAVDQFNFHIRVTDANTSAYIEPYSWPGGSIQYANSEDGSWPGWVAAGGPNALGGQGQYNTLGIEKDEQDFYLYLNETEVIVLENNGLTNMGKILIASDSAAGTTGSLHIDNVIIGDPEGDVGNIAVKPAGKLAACWGNLKSR